MSRAESVYRKLPTVLQNVACSLEGWRIGSGRYGGDFQRLLSEYESRTFWTPEQIDEFQEQRLREFIGVCGGIPFYRRRFREAGVPPEIRSMKELETLPILTKLEVQEAYGGPEWPVALKGTQPVHTSGTTGAGLRFRATRHAQQEQWAVWWRYRKWHGIEPGTWCAYFGGRSVVPIEQDRPPFWRSNLPGRQVLFSAYHLNSRTIRDYVGQLKQRKTPWVHGYPSVLALMASLMQDEGLTLDYQPRWITTGAENLLPHQIRTIERAFGVRPRQHYGMAEAVANFSECELGQLHVDEDFSAVEFVPNSDGVGWAIVGTNFTNPATPLLRYYTGDLVQIGESCRCGRPGRVMAAVDGRQEEYIVLKNGTRLGRMDHVFKDMVNVREAQLVQAEPGLFLVRLVRSGRFTSVDEAALRRELRSRIGPDTEFRLEYVDRIERSQNGKLRFVISTRQKHSA